MEGIIKLNGNSDMLIKFRGTNEMYFFNNAESLLLLLKNYNRYGIDYVKQFDVKTLSYKRCNLATLKRLFGYNTELEIEYLQKLTF